MNTDKLTESRFLIPAIAATVVAIGGTIAAVLLVRRSRQRGADDADVIPADLNDPLPMPDDTSGPWLRMRETIRVEAPPAEVYGYWSDPDNLASTMRNVDSVDVDGDGIIDHLTWRQSGPLGLYTAEWDAEVVTADEDRCIAWKSAADSKVPTAGRVTFAPIEGEDATAVTFSTAFQPPAGQLGAFFAKTLYPMLRRQVRGDLFRVKYDVETLHKALAAAAEA